MLKLGKEDRGGTAAYTDEIIAFLGKGTEFKGIISYEGTVRIDGKVEGEVFTKGTLVVGETAVINAEITAGTVVSGGTINGNITASGKVHLLSPAVLSGSIRTPVLIIEEGVKFNGSCDMNKTDARAGVSLDSGRPKTESKTESMKEATKEAAGKLI